MSTTRWRLSSKRPSFARVTSLWRENPQDVRKACRTTRREGISLIVHGVKTVAPLRQCRRKGAKQEQHGQALESARPMQLTSDGDSSPPPLSKRQQRSHDRLLDYQMRKRKQLLGASTRVQRFLQQYRCSACPCISDLGCSRQNLASFYQVAHGDPSR